MTLRVFIKADCTREEIGHGFLFGSRKLRIRERAGRYRLTLLFGGPEGVSHQLRAVIIVSEVTSGADGDFYFTEAWKTAVSFAAHESWIYLAGDERVKLGFGQETRLAIGSKNHLGT